MLTLVDQISTKEPNKCFKIYYTTDKAELVVATSMGVTEELKEFITFYIENNFIEDELVCMINKSEIKKIETTILPKVKSIVNGKKEYEEA